jgi:excisionase family DNA binding protein
MEERNLSLSEVAGLLGVSERTVRRWIKAGNLRAYKPGRDYRIPASAVRELVEGSEVSPKRISRSALEPSFNDVLRETERHISGLRSWTVLVSRLADRWAGEIARRGQTAEAHRDWAREIDTTATEVIDTASDELEIALGGSTSREAIDLFRALQRLEQVISRTRSWFDEPPADFEAHKRKREERLREFEAIA